MTSKRELLRSQRTWAVSRGLAPDTRGYLSGVEGNLHQPFSPAALEAFTQGGGAELFDRPKAPAKMKALHSSAVLAVNVFDHWMDRDLRPLLDALEVDEPLKAPMRFEARLPTGLPGEPPNVDVLLEFESGRTLGIESKFTEWLTPRRRNRELFRPKYFDAGAKHWTLHGLPRCQQLVEDLAAGREHYGRLDAAQLLKHALGLAASRSAAATMPDIRSSGGSPDYRTGARSPDRRTAGGSLLYLYFDAPCPASAAHRHELARFSQRVDRELGFRAVTYQALFRRLAADVRVDASYLAYLASRYFPGTAGVP